MRRLLPLATLFAVILGHAAQAETTTVRPVKGVAAVAVPAQFTLEGKLPLQVEILPADAMTERDRELASGAASAIRERAQLENISLGEGEWSYREIACPAFPGHLFLRYTRNNGPGDLSAFTASIPRHGNGKVRVIPILRRGYGMFSPAPANGITIGAFNRIRAEEGANAKEEWAAIGLCYAALAGASAPENNGAATLRPASAPLLHLEQSGDAIVTYALGAPQPGDWEMVFDAQGRLVKAGQSRSAALEGTPVPANRAAQSAKPIPPVSEPHGHPIAPNPADIRTTSVK